MSTSSGSNAPPPYAQDLPLPSSSSEQEETYWSHGWNKCKQQPLVPIGEWVIVMIPQKRADARRSHARDTAERDRWRQVKEREVGSERKTKESLGERKES